MADGKNEARILRITQLLHEARTLRTQLRRLIRQYKPATLRDANLVGRVVMRRCATEYCGLKAEPILNFHSKPGAGDTSESQKLVLQSFLLKAASQRFHAHDI
jgi:hypothetical protein